MNPTEIRGAGEFRSVIFLRNEFLEMLFYHLGGGCIS